MLKIKSVGAYIIQIFNNTQHSDCVGLVDIMFSQLIVITAALVGLGACASVGVLNLCNQYGWPTGTYPHPYDCKKFINCNNGVTMELDCPATTVFNPNTKVCDNTINVPICTYNAATNPINVNNICTQFGWGNGNFYHPYDCGQYVRCNAGVTQISACAAGTYYNAATGTCSILPTNSPFCTQYVFKPPTNVLYPNGFDNYCAVNNLANGLHADPYSCFSYIDCTFGGTTHRPCAAGLSFNRATLVCDVNRYVNCNGNLIVGK
ncbi:chondroitin proteoglycan 2 [Aplysia californica]|uniref:Chondroitin proteoglycan 2 n=1 Tax=Aplysia californica TaxID=6500 RepID=A0ABM0JWI7_APLCA|nr:chondroitin proteoglycan 2 [Aplysia californica]